MKSDRAEETRRAVRDRYGAIARGERVGCGPTGETAGTSCCSPGSACGPAPTPTLAMGYSPEDLAVLPEGADLGLGCGNPGALAALRPGETVLDLGSGAGIDCFLAARRVGPEGRVIGVDMTADMVERARRQAHETGATNVEFRLGEIENLPVADASVDVVLSNCVVNLSPDKSRVYREAFRVLRPGGRLAISDIVAKSELPSSIRDDLSLHSGCIAGAVPVSEVEHSLAEAGFENIRVRSRRAVDPAAPGESARPEDWVFSATIEGTKPN